MDCQIANDTYQNLRYILETIPNTYYEGQTNLSRESITTLHKLPPDIATLVILIKNKLLLQKENKTPISQDAIMAIANSQYQIEKVIAFNKNKLLKHHSKWYAMTPILNQNRD